MIEQELLNETKKHKQEIVGYKLKSHIDRKIVDNILKNSMPIWNDKDKSVYFIRGHVAGSLVAKMKELQVLDLWFTPIYENEEVKSDWIKQNHLDYYYKKGIMSNKSKQETLEEVAEKILANNIDGLKYALQDDDLFFFYKGVVQCYGEAMAKWQQERMYSEEEVHNILDSNDSQDWSSENNLDYWEWFEQFKKK